LSDFTPASCPLLNTDTSVFTWDPLLLIPFKKGLIIEVLDFLISAAVRSQKE
jgi:hypothetical protein